MIEILDTFRGGEDAKIESPKTLRGNVWGVSPPHPIKGSGGAF